MTTERNILPAAASRQARSRLSRVGSIIWKWINQQIVRRVREYGFIVTLDFVIVIAAFETATAIRFIDASGLRMELQHLLGPDMAIAAVYAIISYIFGLHRRLWRYASLKDGFALLQVIAITMLVVDGLDVFGRVEVLRPLPTSVIIGGAFLSFLYLGSVKILPRIIATSRMAQFDGSPTYVLIVGAGQEGAVLSSRFLLSGKHGYRVVGFVDDDPQKWRRRINGTPILGPVAKIPEIVKRYDIDLVAIALSSAGPERISQIIALCQETSASIKILPGLHEIVSPPAQKHSLYLREVNVAELLGREVIPLQTDEARVAVEDKVVLVTGAAGSIGSELCRQLMDYGPAKLIALDNNETGLFDLAESLRSHTHAKRLVARIGDITSVAGMEQIFATERPHIVYHVAAYKHVPLLEEHPEQAIRTNVLATYQLCRLAHEYAVGRFVFISSDKAADPVNVLGASKRLGEMAVQAMARSEDTATRFCAVRFGNVIGSRGSVIPTFTRQIEQGGPVTVTDPITTRYFMTIPEACGLVIVTSAIADNGGLFILDMGEPVRIADVAVKMIRLRGLRVGRDVPVVYTGLRPGEKLHEILAAGNETLQPTAHSKIYHVTQSGEVPSLASIDAWMSDLEHSLNDKGNDALRQRLLDLTHSPVSV